MATEAARRGILIILSSPSGAGKSTLAHAIRDWDPSIAFSVSATTRAPRPGEEDGREYWFRSRAEFEAMVGKGEMLEHAEVFDNLYGSPKGPVEDAISQGRDVLFDIDWQGGQQIRQSSLGQDVVSIFVLPPSITELESRLRARAQDSDQVIAGRMQKSQAEISHWAEYDYVLINSDKDRAAAELRTILGAERLKRARQSALGEFVRGLNAEFGDMQ
ncbi:MAG: guanylate kinase [Rhodobacteraceae bacterium]|nr:guanylate kinase [Paracoccaceae bacterium]